MKTLGVIFGLIFLISKIVGKKNQPQRYKKNVREPGGDFPAANVKKKILNSEVNAINHNVKNQETEKNYREDRRSRKEEEEKNLNENSKSSLLFDASEDKKKELVKSIIYSEIIGSPKSLRR